MAKTIYIKLTSASPTSGPFTITDDLGNTLAIDVTRDELIQGIAYEVDDVVKVVIIASTGKCKKIRTFPVSEITPSEQVTLTFTPVKNACLWRHLTNIQLYNYYYGVVEPYIIEYPFAYQFQDEILQNVKDYTRCYKYLPIVDGVFNDNTSIEINEYFNKAILYNGQQNSGLLELVAKPVNNLQDYLKYPLYNTDSKTITFTKSDNFYQYNTFWSLLKVKTIPQFLTTCESLSIDKILNQANMDYGKRSFKKEPLRAKFLKVRHILDNKSDIHLVSAFILTPAQISYK
tara:strand:+ start:1860 stop:2723 length:864 start_codon:yes stop_codon:yes gene_type:complete